MKSEFIQIRVTAEEKTLLAARANRAGLDLSKFILSSATRNPEAQFLRVVGELENSPRPQLQLAELNDLLVSLTGAELRNLPRPALEKCERLHANYIAASVEYASWRAGGTTPEWVREIAPLDAPYFGSSLASLRPYLLRVSPIPFRARNIFIDSTLGDRV